MEAELDLNRLRCYKCDSFLFVDLASLEACCGVCGFKMSLNRRVASLESYSQGLLDVARIRDIEQSRLQAHSNY